MGLCREWFSAWRVNDAMEEMSRKASQLTIELDEGRPIPEVVAATQMDYRLALHDMYMLLNDEEATPIEEIFDLYGVPKDYAND